MDNHSSENPAIKPSIGWLSAASFGVAGTINLFTLGPTLQYVGPIGILLFIIGMLIAVLTGFGWLELILRNPNKVGGASVNTYEAFESRSPLLLAILCFGNWSSWVAQAAFSALFCAAALIQWLSLTNIPQGLLAGALMLIFIGIGMLRLTVAALVMIPAALIAITLTILSAVIPLIQGQVQINTAELMSIKLPFNGWFGYLTAIMSGFYLIGWIVPAYEVTTWLTGEMHQPEKNLPRAFIINMIVSCLSFILLPVIWLGTLGFSQLTADYTTGNNFLVFNKLFAGINPTFATVCGFLFIISYMICSGIGSIVGPSRMLVQLSEYGLFPKVYQSRLENGTPWIAVATTGLLSILIIWLGAPLWLMAATNFGYLASMILATVGAWLIFKEYPEKMHFVSKPLLFLGVLASTVWVLSIIFGFQQYGATSILGGILFVLAGSIFYLWRRMRDAKLHKQPINLYSIHIILPVVFLILMLINSGGYLLAISQVYSLSTNISAILVDIFVTVILLTITIGLLITDSVAHAASQIASASLQLSRVTMMELVKGMRALGSGSLDKINLAFKKTKFKTTRKDELGIMIRNFSELENQIATVFINMDAAREKLRAAREEILKINLDLENRVKERTKQLEIAKKQADDANQSKSRFLANMSHEIRTPMNGILGMLSLALQTNLSGEQREFLETANKCSTLLMSLLNDILDYSKIEAGKLEIEMIPFNLPELVEDVTQLSIESANIKHIEMIISIDNELPQFILGDPNRVRQILSNLIGNAIKFTQTNGEILISAEKVAEDKASSTILFTVKDTGIGIDEETQKVMFNPFVQADASTTRKYGGTGLGLALCKKLIDRMNGRIGVISKPGEGSTFWFELTFKLTAERKGFVPNPLLRGLRMLIVDDNATNRKVLESICNNWGIEYISASSGKQALQILSELDNKKIDIALLDYMMPEMDGMELSTVLHNNNLFTKIPIIIISSSLVRPSENVLKTAGVKEFFLKPLRFEQFHETLVNLLSKNKPSEATSRELKEAKPEQGETIENIHQAKIILVEDNIVNQKVGIELLKKMGLTPDVASNGKEAMEMHETKDYDIILMDCLMPIMDGYTATREIRSRETHGKHVPILAMTALAMPSDEKLCLDAGMDDYILKPINVEQLKSKIIQWLSKNSKFRLAKKMTEETPTPKQSDLINLEVFYRNKEIIKEEFNNILKDYFTDTARLIEEIKIAIEKNDCPNIRSYCHQIKTTALTFGATTLGKIALDIEQLAKQNEIEPIKPKIPELEKIFLASKTQLSNLSS